MGGLNLAGIVSSLGGPNEFYILHAGVESGIFEYLNTKKRTYRSISRRGVAHPDSLNMFLDQLQSVGFIEENDGKYQNAPGIEELFQRGDWNARKEQVRLQHAVNPYLQHFYDSIQQGTNVGLRELKGVGETFYLRLKDNPEIAGPFNRFMVAYSDMIMKYFLKTVDFSEHREILDVGGNLGNNAILLAKQYPKLQIRVYDLPERRSAAEENIAKHGLEGRIKFYGGNMFSEEAFPNGHDAGLIIHNLIIWKPEQKKEILKKTYDALRPGGKVIILESMKNDSGIGPASVFENFVYFMALAAPGAYPFSAKDYINALKEIGFKSAKRIPWEDPKPGTAHRIVRAQK